jgi:hypothetical protein
MTALSVIYLNQLIARVKFVIGVNAGAGALKYLSALRN